MQGIAMRTNAFSTLAVLLLLSANSSRAQFYPTGYTDKPAAAPAPAKDSSAVMYYYGDHGPCDACDDDCSRGKCYVDWLQPWTCADLKQEPAEPPPCFCGWKGFFWCPEEDQEECDSCQDNGNGEETKENGNGKCEDNKENGDCNGVCEEAEDDAPSTPTMQAIACYFPKVYEKMERNGDTFTGWIQQGFTLNVDSPRDRMNFGTNYNWRSNDYRLNQIGLTYENALEHDGHSNVGYRIDFMAGNDTPFNVSNGLFDHVVGTGFVNRVGIDLPQFYIEGHLPHCIGSKGVDIRFGKWYTLMGYEVLAAPGTDFYSHSYAYFYAMPFTHTGGLATIHATDTLDVLVGIVRGWDQFEDNNDRVSYTGAFIWTSCDGRYVWTTAWITGPEQDNDNGNYRTLVTSNISTQFGNCNQWKAVVAGHYAIDSNAVVEANGVRSNGQWYAVAGYLFYTLDPRLTPGLRAEWFHDNDGLRTNFVGTFCEVTAGVTWSPWKNLRIRPELRLDWSPDVRAYNDQTDKYQGTAAVDMIWEF
jgi:hypothetical protein